MLAGLLLASASSSGPLGCSGNQIGGTDVDMSGGGDDGGGTGGGDGGTGGGGDGGQSAYCMGKGPPIVVGDSTGGTARCSGQVAASVFRYAMCLCQGLSSSSPVTTDSFDSTAPGQMTLGNGGSVGVNSNVNAGALSVGGSLVVTGAVTLNSMTVGVDAQISDRFSANQSADIKRNAQIGSDVICNGPAQSLKIAGSLTFPAGKTLTANSPVIGGGQIRAAVNVPAPCDCSGAGVFNIASYVTERASNNDNAAIGLDPARLTNFAGDQTLNLNCGRFYLNRIGGAGKLTLNVSGRTALFIGGDVNLNDAFTVNLGATGELDLFINGGLTSSAAITFGNKNQPARVRLYMGGARNINLAAGSTLGGNVYGPESALVTSGPLEVFGSIFVRSFNPSAAVTIHHDLAILKAAEDCNPTGGGGGGGGGNTSSCTRCQDCGGQACKAGTCGSCTVGSDCCSPLSCKLGKCVFEIG